MSDEETWKSNSKAEPLIWVVRCQRPLLPKCRTVTVQRFVVLATSAEEALKRVRGKEEDEFTSKEERDSTWTVEGEPRQGPISLSTHMMEIPRQKKPEPKIIKPCKTGLWIEKAQVILPQYASGSDWNAKRKLVISVNDHVVFWRPGVTAWASRGVTSYYGGVLVLVGPGSSHNEIAEDGRLSTHLKDLVIKGKIAEHLGVKVVDLPMFKPGRTYAFEGKKKQR